MRPLMALMEAGRSRRLRTGAGDRRRERACDQAAGRAAQNAQLCVLAKSVSVCGAGGASDCTFWVRALKSGQSGVPDEAGDPLLAKFVQYPCMVAASCCCGAESACGKATVGRSIRYWTSDPWAAP